MFMVATYNSASVFTCIYAYFALSRKGINQEQRSYILYRNIYYQIIIIVCNSSYYFLKCIVYIKVAYADKYFDSEIFPSDDQ